MIIAIVGSGGRGKDIEKLNPQMWTKVKQLVANFIAQKRTSTLISGGCAWADSLAVEYFISSFNFNYNLLSVDLILCLPCKFDLDNNKFVEDGFQSPGARLNYLHKKYIQKLNGRRDSLAWLGEAIRHKNCEVFYGDGFFERNNIVANKAHTLLAITFGKENQINDGGTAYTAKRFIKKNGNENAYHLDLNSMVIYPNAIVK